MARINQLDPLVDLDSLFETNFNQSSGNEIEEDNISWNVFLINKAANDFCVSFPKDLTNNQKEHEILYSKLIKTDDQEIHMLFATTRLKEPETYNVEFVTNCLWKIDEKPNVLDNTSHSLFIVKVPIPSFKCGDIVKASFKLIGDNGSVMTSSKSIIYEKDGSNSARLIYGPSLDNEKLQINSINEIELLKRYFSLLNF